MLSQAKHFTWRLGIGKPEVQIVAEAGRLPRVLHRWLTGSIGPEEICLHFLAAVVVLHRCIASVGTGSTGPEATDLSLLDIVSEG